MVISANHDGDSLRIESAIMWPIYAVRVRGVDTPEIGWRARCPVEQTLAERAKIFTRDHIVTAQHVILSDIEEDKYGRLLARVTLDGEDLAQMLIDAGLGMPYDGGKRKSWCGGE